MGKTKRKGVSKPNKKQREKKREKGSRKYNDKQWSVEKFKLKHQLAMFGLDIKEVKGDGNCLFRAISDQISGNEDMQEELRQAAVSHIQAEKFDFEPFIEDDEPFDDYIRRMSRSGTWGGNLELQALSQYLQVNIQIHRADEPIWEIMNFHNVRSIHLSYQDGDHYNSVRLKGDLSNEPPAFIPEILQIEEIKDETCDNRFRTLAELFIEVYSVGDVNSVMNALKRIYQEPPEFDEVLNEYGKIAHEVYNEEITEKKGKNEKNEKTERNEKNERREKNEKGREEVKKQDQLNLRKRPAKLPANKARCWCNSGRIYKICCKATDYLREIEEEKIVTKMDSLQI